MAIRRRECSSRVFLGGIGIETSVCWRFDSWEALDGALVLSGARGHGILP